jgi:peptide/nickel transport system substrate-binding protein
MKTPVYRFAAVIILSLMLIISLLLTACGGSTSPSTPSAAPGESTGAVPSTGSVTATQPVSGPQYGGILRIVINPVSPGFGWPASVGGQGLGVNQYCFETLLRCDSAGNIYPWLAESYKLADDLKSITFNLRKDVKFHDGSDFNAEAVKWNIDNYIKGGMESLWASAEIIDGSTVRVNFKQWDNTLPASFGDASTEAYMISKAAFDKNGKAWVTQNPVGTGPFKFGSFILDTSLKYVKNPDYWKKDDSGNQLPYLDGVEYVFSGDVLTQNNMMKMGEADMFMGNMGEQLTVMKEMGLEIAVSINSSASLVPDTMNADSPWYKKEVREAVEYAIDREAMAKAFGYGYLQAPYQIPQRGTTPYNPDFTLGRKYDVSKAKELLAQAGYPSGFETTLIVPSMIDKNYAVAMQAALDVVGIKVNLDYPQSGKWVTYMGPSGKWQNAAMILPLPMIDTNFAGGLAFIHNVTGGSWARTDEFNKAYTAAFSTPVLDPKNISLATDIITRDGSIIPIMESGSVWAYQPYIMASFNKRATPGMWDTETAWLNK